METLDQSPVELHVFVEAHRGSGEVVIEEVRQLVGGAGVGNRDLLQSGRDVLEQPRNRRVGCLGQVEADDPLVGEDHESIPEGGGGEVVSEGHEPILKRVADMRPSISHQWGRSGRFIPDVEEKWRNPVKPAQDTGHGLVWSLVCRMCGDVKTKPRAPRQRRSR
jgi:hypothetical protein